MEANTENKSTVLEKTLSILIFVALLYVFYQTISVFLGIFTFAIIFAVPFSSLYEKLTGKLAGKRKLSALLYGGVLVAFVAVPLVFLISALAEQAHSLMATMNNIRNHHIPELPQWLLNIPVVGNKVSAFWAQLEADPEKTLSMYEPQIRHILQKLMSAGGGIFSTAMEIIAGIILSAVLLYRGHSSVDPLRRFFTRLVGSSNADAVLDSSEKAINGVAIGVMGTAVLEALMGWLGFKIAGIDMATGLAAVIFLFTVIQVGSVVVMLPFILWMFSKGDTGWGIFFIVWTVFLMVIDNVVKPMLIGKSGKMPVLVMFLGVIGGMAAWGFTGMFKGAIVLAISYTIFTNWLATPNPKPQTPIPS